MKYISLLQLATNVVLFIKISIQMINYFYLVSHLHLGINLCYYNSAMIKQFANHFDVLARLMVFLLSKPWS